MYCARLAVPASAEWMIGAANRYSRSALVCCCSWSKNSMVNLESQG